MKRNRQTEAAIKRKELWRKAIGYAVDLLKDKDLSENDMKEEIFEVASVIYQHLQKDPKDLGL